jgi:uncharacterized protein (DUF2147 family)
MKRVVAWTVIVLTALTVPVTASAKAELEGQWRNPKGSVVVKVEQCGNAYCGIVVRASDKARANARKGGTANLVGTRILSGLRQAQHLCVGDGASGRSERNGSRRLRARRHHLRRAALDAGRRLTSGIILTAAPM